MKLNLMLNGLDRVQKQAAMATGYVRVLGGPGTGKTKLLVTRLCQLIQSGVDQRNIVTFSFNENLMMAMRRWTTELTGKYLLSDICTFHNFCFNIVKHNIYRTPFPNKFIAIDSDNKLKLLRIVYADLGVSADKYPPGKMLEHISMVKGRLDYVQHFHRAGTPDIADDLGLDISYAGNEIFIYYLMKQLEHGALDTDDILYFALFLLKLNKDLLDETQDRAQCIQVDEFQDVNKAQFELLMLLQGKHKNLCVAGDPDQAIYTSQGGNRMFLNNFAGHFPGTQTFMLTENSRSDFSIFTACNSLINTIGPKMEPADDLDGQTCSHEADDDADEARFIARHTGQTNSFHEVPYKDIAILYRASPMTRLIEEALIESSIPYTVADGPGFYCRPEIEDALAFLSLLVYADNNSFERIINKPYRDIDRMHVYALQQYALKRKVTIMQALLDCAGQPPYSEQPVKNFIKAFKEIKAKLGGISTSQALAEILDKTGYEEWLKFDLNGDKINNIRELKRAVAEQEEAAGGRLDIAGYLNRVGFYAGFAAVKYPDSVQLMTIHSSKGKEFPFVTVCGLNEGVLPSPEGDIDEERRLAYVACSRARDGLMLTCVGESDEPVSILPSRFLSDMEPYLTVQ